MGVVVPNAPRPDRTRPPSPAEAAQTLRELSAIRGRSRRVAHATFTRGPLVLWGVAWLLGYAALDTLPWPVAIPAGLALSGAAALGTRLSRSQQVVSGWEQHVQRSWLVLMASSPLLVLTITPAPVHAVPVFLGSLCGVALLLLAVAAGDIPVGVLGAVIVTTAAAVRILAPDHDLLVFGSVAGGAMTALGVCRMVVSR